MLIGLCVGNQIDIEGWGGEEGGDKLVVRDFIQFFQI